jgi:hypothetical protein
MAKCSLSAQDFKQKIKQAEDDILAIKQKIALLKKQLSDIESDLITASLTKERAKEGLREYLNVSVSEELSARKLEIDEFRKKYPDLCQKN